MTDRRGAADETPKERGRRWGCYFRAEGRNYGKVGRRFSHFPSNPYPEHSADAFSFDEGYEEGFNGN